MVGVRAPRDHLVPLVLLRNRLAYQLVHPVQPPLKRESHVCGRCERLPLCMLVHKAHEGGTSESAGLGALFGQHTDHLTVEELAWYAKWDNLTRAEWAASDELRAEMWSMTGSAREKLGRCFARMRVVDGGLTPVCNG